jgi:hypothetical protein
MGLKRQSEINGIPEVTDLKEGMDFRLPEHRRETFLRFYGFHLQYRSHPGAVYYVMPYLAEKYEWDFETRLWFAFINGATQNPLTSWVIFNRFPSIDVEPEEMEKWHRAYWRNLDYDIDRRYQKGHFVEMFENYKELLNGKSQVEYFTDICCTDNAYDNFTKLWDVVYNDFFMYGRLSTFSYTEYLKIMGLNIDCDTLLIHDKSGSKSHRNGLCKVLGRDDLDVDKRNEKLLPGLEKGHTKEIMDWLEHEGELLMNEAKVRFQGTDFEQDVNYYTLESTLCCYKSWHRINRRYPNVYNDMFYDRIKKAETRDWYEIDGMSTTFEDFWDARRKYLPKELRLEDNPNDPGLVKVKQNWYRLTGEVPMMEHHDPIFKNNFMETWQERQTEWYGNEKISRPTISKPAKINLEEWL